MDMDMGDSTSGSRSTSTSTSKVYPPRKYAIMSKIEALAKEKDVIAVSSLHKVRATQIMSLKKSLRGKTEIVASKNKLAAMALRKTGINEEFIKVIEGQKVLIFTDLNPFELYLTLEKNRVNLPARGGDIATDDIVVPSGNTGLPPGPVLSDFKAVGVPTKIDSGSIWVSKDTVVAKMGEEISPKLAGLMSKLGIKPIKAGLSVDAALIEGIILKEQLKIDPAKYLEDLKSGHIDSLALAQSIAYPAKEILPNLITKAYRDALALSVGTAYPMKEATNMILSKAQAQAVALESKLKEKGYSN